MGTQSNGTDLSRRAGENLSAHQFKAVKLNGSGEVVLAGLGERALGILQNKPASGESATVRVGGVSKMKAGGNISAGDVVKSSAAGLALAAAAATVNTGDAGAASDAVVGSYTLGQALDSAVNNDVFALFITHSGAVATTAA